MEENGEGNAGVQEKGERKGRYDLRNQTRGGDIS